MASKNCRTPAELFLSFTRIGSWCKVFGTMKTSKASINRVAAVYSSRESRAATPFQRDSVAKEISSLHQ
ncbi:unnamed protein product [Amoebophrya sp. A120]|nr:unnamed protein product [Amoebophrya sp. A120]|eukprot:GSA120T00019404001.1